MHFEPKKKMEPFCQSTYCFLQRSAESHTNLETKVLAVESAFREWSGYMFLAVHWQVFPRLETRE
jgi:hypothetical protein